MNLKRGIINMTQYSFKCSKCGLECDFGHDMQNGAPKTEICPSCGGLMNRDYSKVSVLIPPNFNPSENPIKFGKRERNKRKYH